METALIIKRDYSEVHITFPLVMKNISHHYLTAISNYMQAHNVMWRLETVMWSVGGDSKAGFKIALYYY